MTSDTVLSRPSASTALVTFRGIAPMVAIVFLGFFAIGTPLAALSLQVHDRLGFGTLIVGLVVGLQAVSTILTRHLAGSLSDRGGPRRVVLMGLPLTASSGLIFLASSAPALAPATALALILVARVCMGLGESLFIIGAMSWGLIRLGPARTGTVMSWQGIAMYAAIGLGAPAGLVVQRTLGFAGVSIVTMATPLLAMVVAFLLPAVPGGGGLRVPFHRVLGLVWRPGLVLALATAPFAALVAFVALDFGAHDWPGAGFALGGFAAGYIFVRLFFAHWPDRFGGVRVAMLSLALEAVGQALLWLAPDAPLAIAGACISGLGYSLIFPSMGVEAVKRVAPDMRGRAVGNFMAFFDLAIAVTAPAVGLAVGYSGYSSAFLIGTVAAILALVLTPGVRRMGAK